MYIIHKFSGSLPDRAEETMSCLKKNCFNIRLREMPSVLKINTVKFKNVQQTFLQPSYASSSRFGEILLMKSKFKWNLMAWWTWMRTTANGACKVRLPDETVANCNTIKAQSNNPDRGFGQFSPLLQQPHPGESNAACYNHKHAPHAWLLLSEYLT